MTAVTNSIPLGPRCDADQANFSLLQALTQIQEQTLSFGVKLAAVGLTLYLTARWMGGDGLELPAKRVPMRCPALPPVGS